MKELLMNVIVQRSVGPTSAEVFREEFPRVYFEELYSGDYYEISASFTLVESFAEFLCDASENYRVLVSPFYSCEEFGLPRNTLLVELLV
jgi:hypothetical protein